LEQRNISRPLYILLTSIEFRDIQFGHLYLDTDSATITKIYPFWV